MTKAEIILMKFWNTCLKNKPVLIHYFPAVTFYWHKVWFPEPPPAKCYFTQNMCLSICDGHTRTYLYKLVLSPVRLDGFQQEVFAVSQNVAVKLQHSTALALVFTGFSIVNMTLWSCYWNPLIHPAHLPVFSLSPLSQTMIPNSFSHFCSDSHLSILSRADLHLPSFSISLSLTRDYNAINKHHRSWEFLPNLIILSITIINKDGPRADPWCTPTSISRMNGRIWQMLCFFFGGIIGWLEVLKKKTLQRTETQFYCISMKTSSTFLHNRQCEGLLLSCLFPRFSHKILKVLFPDKTWSCFLSATRLTHLRLANETQAQLSSAEKESPCFSLSPEFATRWNLQSLSSFCCVWRKLVSIFKSFVYLFMACY